MLIFPGLLVAAAKEAGMKVPDDAEDFDPEQFPHFAVFCNAQLARVMSSPNEHWENAKVIAHIPDEAIHTVTLIDLVNRYHFVTTLEF